jgi:Obg family GTPase CgtA
MVRLSGCLHLPRKEYKHFIDSLRVFVKAGNGGQGLAKFNGFGGRGGNVYIVGSQNATFKMLNRQFPSRRFCAQPGEDSSARALQGAHGPALDIVVPTGVCIKTDFGTVVGEINKSGDRVLVASGGLGGCPANHFVGQKGSALSLNLDLKLISDIGLVGFPNAGKSTLLRALSRAAPKIASYPFTTIQPQIGIIQYEDHRQISVADLPGLVEGAHINVGMGHKFLKHVERTKLLMFVVDVHGFRLSAKHELRSAFQNVILLNKELELYSPQLVNKPAILVINKIDVDGAHQLADETIELIKNMKENIANIEAEYRPEQLIKFDDILTISAKHNLNLTELRHRLRQLLDLYIDMESDRGTVDRKWKALKKSASEHYGQQLEFN